MKKILPLIGLPIIMISCSGAQLKNEKKIIDKKTIGLLPTEKRAELEKIAEFHGVQVTGVTVSHDGRVFANFPRWRNNLPFSVVEVFPDGSFLPYPNEKWNEWRGRPEDYKFTSVQSVVAHGKFLYVLDPSSPEMKGVIGKAKLHQFNLSNNRHVTTWVFDGDVAPKMSYLNDLRVDDKNSKVYITDSGLGGIVVLDLVTGSAQRVLDKHQSTKSERNVVLTVEKQEFKLQGKAPAIHSDGIALSPVDGRLYYHPLTGYNLYSVPTKLLNNPDQNKKLIEKSVVNVGRTPAPDGMIFDRQGNLYMGDLERNAVSYRRPDGQMEILIQDERIKWPDSLAIDNQNNLIFTDSRLHEAKPGSDVSHLSFPIYRVKLPQDSSRQSMEEK
jgi:sugar lactone lactonase YvrE